MSMTEETEVKAPAAPKKKKQKRKVAPRAKAAEAAKPASPFAGISATECCDGCGGGHCVISGIDYCAHPFKSGLQSAMMNDQEIMKRYNKAKAELKNQMIDLRNR